MRLALLFLSLVTAGTCAAGVALPLRRAAHTVILEAVYLDGQGPLRMALDTGNASSLIRQEVAHRLGARLAYSIEHVTSAGVQRLPVAVIGQLAVGPVVDRKIEVMIGAVALDGADGVLGQSWLCRHDYLLDYRALRLVLDGEPPEGVLRMDLRSLDGRPAVAALVDGVERLLVLDSGASNLVLFESQFHITTEATLFANGQSTAADWGSARIALAGCHERRMAAARVNAPELSGGLLPASAFRAIYVSQSKGLAALLR